jgi:GAF domain-containing protein
MGDDAATVEQLRAELRLARERESALAEVLRIIAASPTDVQRALDSIAGLAGRLCEATDVKILRVADGLSWEVAHHGRPTHDRDRPPSPLRYDTITGRAALARRSINVDDVQAEHREFPRAAELGRLNDARSMLATPMLSRGDVVGVIHVRQSTVRPFTSEHVVLLEAFADQAVIAIENARLFEELEQRNAELSEALEQQTATADVLRVIASSPTEVQRVLDAIAETAARLCDAQGGAIHRLRARDGRLSACAATGFIRDRNLQMYGPDYFDRLPGTEVSRQAVAGRTFLERRTIVVADATEAVRNEYPASRDNQDRTRQGSVAAVPLIQRDEPIGVLHVSRFEVRPFTDQQVALLETFADQAVIAIENARLFEELEQRNRELADTLEQQTATSDLLRVIASSPTDALPVLNAVAHSAMRLSESVSATVLIREDEQGRIVATAGDAEHPVGTTALLSQQRIGTVAVREGRTIHVPDMSAPSYWAEFPDAVLRPARAVLVVPLMRGDVVIGGLHVSRDRAQPYSQRQIDLVRAFADQAVIAIENARLFAELEQRNSELHDALEQQTATSEILRVIASSPTDGQRVLDTITRSAVRLCNASDGLIWRSNGDEMVIVTVDGPHLGWALGMHTALDRTSVAGRAVVDRQLVHMTDPAHMDREEWSQAASFFGPDRISQCSRRAAAP